VTRQSASRKREAAGFNPQILLAEVAAALEGGPPVCVATVIAAPADSDAQLGLKMLVRPDGSAVGSLGVAALDAAVRGEAPDAFRRHAVETLYVDRGGRLTGRLDAPADDSYQVMMEVHERPATLLVIGAGHVGKALATIGNMCGFSVEIVDDRPEYANAERFPEADRITCGRFDEVLSGYPIDANTYVVCVTRGHKHDETSLRLVAASDAAYVGMIGSKRRVGAVLQHLMEGGLAAAAAERVHTPIGLDIGAETPEEIAVSIMAEIIRTRHGGSALPMREVVRGRRRGVAPADREPRR
jgi:xanthine dehydrogenase accessory factor